MKNDCKKTAQFHPKYVCDSDGTNVMKILKNLPKFKKSEEACHNGKEH
jgi:hypothetical protein